MNKVVLIGRLTRDPELRYTQSNIPAASFTLAVNTAQDQPGKLLPTVGKKIKLEVLN